MVQGLVGCTLAPTCSNNHFEHVRNMLNLKNISSYNRDGNGQLSFALRHAPIFLGRVGGTKSLRLLLSPFCVILKGISSAKSSANYPFLLETAPALQIVLVRTCRWPITACARTGGLTGSMLATRRACTRRKWLSTRTQGGHTWLNQRIPKNKYLE